MESIIINNNKSSLNDSEKDIDVEDRSSTGDQNSFNTLTNWNIVKQYQKPGVVESVIQATGMV